MYNVFSVEFVMAYMAGKLVRRLRSGRVRSHKCPSSQTCVKEVVTSNFDEIVLDEAKVGRWSLY